MPQIVITEFMDNEAAEGLAADYDVLFDPTLCERPDEIIEVSREARALIVRNRTQVRGELLAAAANLEAVGRLGVGLDNIDMDACKERGIAVLPAVGANAATVAEYVMAGILMLLRGVYFSNPAMITGKWPRTELIGREAGGRRLGLGRDGVGRMRQQPGARHAGPMGGEQLRLEPRQAARCQQIAPGRHWIRGLLRR